MAQQLKTNHEIVSDKAKNPVTTSEYIKHGDEWLDDVINGNSLGLVIVDGKICVKFESEV